MTKLKIFISIIFIIIIFFSFMHYNYAQPASIDKIYIINLDKSLERYKRMQKKLNPMKLTVAYNRFSAIDGRQIKFSSNLTHEIFSGQEILDKKIWLKGDFDARCQGRDDSADHVLIRNLNQDEYNRRIPGEVGCTCSHKKIWQEIVDKNYNNTLILEDDIRFIPFFDTLLNSAMNNAPKDYDLLYLHYRNYGQAFNSENDNVFSTIFDTYFKNFFWKRARKNIMSTRSYILTKEGAKKLLQCVNNYEKENFTTIDINMANCINTQKIIVYASKPKFVLNDNSSGDVSDIYRLESKN